MIYSDTHPQEHHLCYIIRLDNNLTPTHGNYEASRKFEDVMEQEQLEK